MIEALYEQYIKDTVRLVSSMSIKYQDHATLVNEDLTLRYGPSAVDAATPSTWRYYLNLAGQYHPSDTVMTIRSLDTGEEIVFSQEALAKHTYTAHIYRQKTQYYYALVNAYPLQERLINSILFPASLDVAVSAPDATLLAWDTSLIEPQEVTLIHDLQTYLYNYNARWNVRAFMTSDAYYPSACYAVMLTTLIGKILALRWARAKTAQAHSFHINAYLASHEGLDAYVPYLTLEQQLWLYRNITYINTHSGLREVFDALVDMLLTRRKVPLAQYKLLQMDAFDEKYYPIYQVERTTLNLPQNLAPLTLDELAAKESTLSEANAKAWQNDGDVYRHAIASSNNGVLLTKDLESYLIDKSNNVPHTLESVFFNEWGYRALTQNYRPYIRFQHPFDGVIYEASADVLFVYVVYLYLRAQGGSGGAFPQVLVHSVLKEPSPTQSDLASLIPVPLVTYRRELDAFYNRLPSERNPITIDAFSEFASTLYRARLQDWFSLSNLSGIYDRAYVGTLFNAHYAHELIDTQVLYPDETIESFFTRMRLPTTALILEDALKVISVIFSAATGYDSAMGTSLSVLQAKLLAILKLLTSYSVQYIYDTALSNVRPLTESDIRVSAVNLLQNTRVRLPTSLGIYNDLPEGVYYNRLSSDAPDTLRHDQSHDPYVNPTRRFSRGIFYSQRSLTVNEYHTISENLAKAHLEEDIALQLRIKYSYAAVVKERSNIRITHPRSAGSANRAVRINEGYSIYFGLPSGATALSADKLMELASLPNAQITP